MFLVFHEIFRLAVLINFVLIKKKECRTKPFQAEHFFFIRTKFIRTVSLKFS